MQTLTRVARIDMGETSSPNQLISMEDQEELQAIGETSTRNNFRIGDIALKYILRAAMNDQPVTQKRIEQNIGVFCGKSGRTVRYYYETASFFSPETRDEYHMLFFAHFVLARRAGERWRKVLDYAVDHIGSSVDTVAAHFSIGDCVAVASGAQDDDCVAVASGAQDVEYRGIRRTTMGELVSTARSLADRVDDILRMPDFDTTPQSRGGAISEIKADLQTCTATLRRRMRDIVSMAGTMV